MEVTKREVIASVTIVAIMLLLGFLISGKISDAIMDSNEVYNKALKIEDTELFKYGMNTNTGNAFVYGDLEAVDTVSFPEVPGQYMSTKKVKEVYTMHTKVESYTVNGKRMTRVKTYWTWDYAGKEEKQAKRVTFRGVEFDSSRIYLPSTDHIDTIKTSSTVRYKYYGSAPKHTGTIFAYLANNDIGDNVHFYKDMDTQQAYDYVVSSAGLFLFMFWLIWIFIIGACVYGFYYAENKWLE